MQAELFTTSALLPDIIKHNESPKVTSATIIRTRETWELFWGLTKLPTFRKATTHSVFPAKCRLKKGAQKFHTGDVSPPRSGKCSLLVEANSLTRRSTRSCTQIWKVKGHQHGISALVPQTSYRRKTSHWMWRREMSTISQATSFHPRIKHVFQQIRLLQVATKSVCNVLCTDPRKWSHSSCKTDLSSVCSYSNLKKGIKMYQIIENKMKI